MINILEKILKFSLLLTPFALLFVFSDLIFPYITGKHLVWRALVSVALASYTALALLKPQEHLPSGKSVIAKLLLAFFAVFVVVDIFFAIDRSYALWSNFERMDGLYNLFYLTAYAWLLRATFKEKDFTLLFKSFAISAGVIILAALQQVAQFGFSERANVILNNPIYIAVFMLFASAFFVFIALDARRKFEKYLYLLFATLAVFVLLATQTRGAIVGFAVGIFTAAAYLVFRHLKKVGNKKHTFKWLSITVLAFVLVTGAGFAALKDSQVFERFKRASFKDESSTLYSRALLWQMSFDIAKVYPMGAGHEAMQFLFSEFYNPKLYKHEVWFDRVHNQYLDTLVQGGIAALLVFVALLAYAMCALLFKIKEDDSKKAAILFALMSYAVFALSAFDNLSSSMPLYALLAFLAYKESELNVDDKSGKTLNTLRQKGSLINHEYVALAFAVLLATFLLQRVYIDYRAAASLVDTIRLSYQLNNLNDRYKDGQYKSLNDKKLERILTEQLESMLDKLHVASLSYAATNKELLTVATNKDVQQAFLSFPQVKLPQKMEYIEFVRAREKEMRNAGHPNYLVLNAVAVWYQELGLPGISEKIYKVLIQKAPHKIHLYESLVKTYIAEKKYKEAQNYLDKLILLQPKNERAIKLQNLLDNVNKADAKAR